jgi:hypothetical protein
MLNLGECGAVSRRTARNVTTKIRPSRVDAESIATAIPVVIGGKAMQVSAMPYGPRYYRYYRYYPC